MRLSSHARAMLAGVALACTNGQGPADRPVEFEIVVPQDRYARVNGVQLHYLDWGGDGDLQLLVPGLSHTAHTYDAIAPAFVDRFRVVAVSEKPGTPFDLATLVDDLDAFLGLFPDRAIILAGQSYAGMELPRLARRHAVRRWSQPTLRRSFGRSSADQGDVFHRVARSPVGLQSEQSDPAEWARPDTGARSSNAGSGAP